jgi:hypothetical protein
MTAIGMQQRIWKNWRAVSPHQSVEKKALAFVMFIQM